MRSKVPMVPGSVIRGQGRTYILKDDHQWLGSNGFVYLFGEMERLLENFNGKVVYTASVLANRVRNENE